MTENSSETPEVFRGHLDECLRFLGNTLVASIPKGSKGAAQAKRPLADFCGVSIDCVQQWLRNASLPIGEQRVKLMCYLDMMGFRVIELERMPKIRRNFLELIGFGLISGRQAAELLGYTTVSRTYEVLRGACNASTGKRAIMLRECSSRKEELEKRKNDAETRYRLDIPPKVQPKKAETEPVTLPSSGLQQCIADEILVLSARLSTLGSQLKRSTGVSKPQKGGT
ncbi:MAG: hypothetical protein AAB635_01090 [Patescibacteria group bacterium]|mgnify:CR=1 FL=1